MSASTTDPMIGRLIDGRYQVRSRIARGGMATVYLATDLRLERRVAVKIMHEHLADDSQFKERFIQEARSAARLAHPNVVNVFDQGQDEDSAYLVMEYLPGITLRELLQEYGRLTPEQTMDIVEAVLSGLAAAHKAGIVHRDLKPENVLLADDGRIKIGDFGLARAASANTATGKALLGTIAYLSPELVTRGIADTRSDIYAVGIMMYEMLTGEQPYKGEQPMQIAYQHAHESVPAPSSASPEVPAELDELVLWATARDPDHRPRDARVMLEQVYEMQEALRTALPATAQRTRVLPPAMRDVAATAEETQVMSGRTRALGPVPRVPAAAAPALGTGPALSESTAALAAAARRGRSRGWALFLVVLLLAASGGVIGWWFSAGPGALVTIPTSLHAASEQDARTRLDRLGFTVAPQTRQEYSTSVAPGLVVDTSPSLGASVVKGSTITLLLSAGPKPWDVPAFAGMQEDAALAAVKAHWTAQTPIRQFDAKAPSGTVLDALGQDQQSLSGTKQYPEQAPITLVVSAGPVPDVAGLSYDDAAAKLHAAGLTAVQGPQEYNDDVDEGDVIGIVPNADGSAPVLRVGDSVTLRISKGPEPVAVPAVVGKTWAVAKKALTDAGFALDYSSVADAFPNAFVVSKTSPDGGTLAPKGSTIKVNFAGF